MKTILHPVLLFALFCGCSTTQTKPDPASSHVNPADLRRMWETEPLGGRPRKLASTERAVQAAERVFSAVQLRGKTRQQVSALLGDPKHSNRSTYNFPFYPAPADALVYRFDTGTGGCQFNILFDRRDKARKVEKYGIQ